jgi:alanyl-tRNA synthetase
MLRSNSEKKVSQDKVIDSQRCLRAPELDGVGSSGDTVDDVGERIDHFLGNK